MRNPVNALRSDLVRTAKAARESLAAERFALENLRAAMTAAAGSGFDQTTIAGPDGVDLRDTDAVQVSLAWLAEMKLDYAWEPRGGGIAASHDLIVSWRIKLTT